MAHLVLDGGSADGSSRDRERLVGRAFDYPCDSKELRPSLVPAFRHAVGDGNKHLNDDGLRLQKPSVEGGSGGDEATHGAAFGSTQTPSRGAGQRIRGVSRRKAGGASGFHRKPQKTGEGSPRRIVLNAAVTAMTIGGVRAEAARDRIWG